jgi:ActR/RegA family two-component response regulator
METAIREILPGRILIADGDHKACKSLKRLLEASGYSADWSCDADEAIGKCKENHPEIAFIELAVPKMSSLELLSCIRGLSRRTDVVVLTGCGTIARAVEAMKLGAVEFIEKPFDPVAIPILCRELLLRRKLDAGGSVDEMLELAELARRRGAHLAQRAYLKQAMLRDATRPEPYFELGKYYERECDVGAAVNYYYMALDAGTGYQPARDALVRLGAMSIAPNPPRSISMADLILIVVTIAFFAISWWYVKGCDRI